MPGPAQRWRQTSRWTARVTLPFDDIMEFALAVLSVSPSELKALGWTFADRKRLLDHFLASGKAAQGSRPEHLAKMPIELTLPTRDEERLRHFARRELPKMASNAGVMIVCGGRWITRSTADTDSVEGA